MVNINSAIIYHKEYDDVRMEYGQIVKEYVIPKGNNATLN